MSSKEISPSSTINIAKQMQKKDFWLKGPKVKSPHESFEKNDLKNISDCVFGQFQNIKWINHLQEAEEKDISSCHKYYPYELKPFFQITPKSKKTYSPGRIMSDPEVAESSSDEEIPLILENDAEFIQYKPKEINYIINMPIYGCSKEKLNAILNKFEEDLKKNSDDFNLKRSIVLIIGANQYRSFDFAKNNAFEEAVRSIERVSLPKGKAESPLIYPWG